MNEETLTEEERARMEAWLAAHPYGAQDENGIDLSLLRENLKLTPTERLRQHGRALARWRTVRNAGRKLSENRSSVR